MANKTANEISVMGSGKMPKQLARDLITPKHVLENPKAARIQKLLVLHPHLTEFQSYDLNTIDEAALSELLKRVEATLKI
jgi:hypothetical protein